ncbi:hypothetical protein GT037_002839 [Alternaria burnsii]|uniref:Uncharacterized protein n=1 Tax=Alternaria burnsii TaxID=1187904 RepID=A0A8H7EIC6_9PLEO|nr:uncharacterized protein GT037_002839 [Alternaria burnsii]KAF7679091.1 hypothetical protein GT037_002839 [Alternaria burnsii]
MTSSPTLHDTFGCEPFDHFLLEKWDPESTLHQDEQERNIVRAWISLGQRGRYATDVHVNQPYFERCREDDISLPDHIPSNLSVFEKRKATDPDNWGVAGVIWIRTWYGNEASLDNMSDKEIVTRASADEAYTRLWRKASCPPQDHYKFNADLFGPNVFKDDATAYGVIARDADDEVELMSDVPSFILSALIQCPDAMEPNSGSRDTAEDDDDLRSRQALLVVVADREACEDGWVLLVALNHKGQVLHMRVRCKAYQVSEQVYSFRDGGEPLDITEGEENVIHYLDGNQSGDGWDED